MKPPDAKFAAFLLSHVPYTRVHSHPILTSVLIPKNLLSRQQPTSSRNHTKTTTAPIPLVIRIHGGSLTGGPRLGDWLRPWTLQLAEHLGAILLSPDYRLLPESNGGDILDDMRTFWHWCCRNSGLAAAVEVMAPGLGEKVDLGKAKVIVVGESAGAWVSWGLMGACHEEKEERAGVPDPRDAVKILILVSPMIDVADEYFTKPDAERKRYIGDNTELFAEDTVERYLETLPNAFIISDGNEWRARSHITMAMYQWGLFGKYLERDVQSEDIRRRLYPIERLKSVEKGTWRTPIWILNGKKDSIVSIQSVMVREPTGKCVYN
jgi:acetyl esterase/lipase